MNEEETGVELIGQLSLWTDTAPQVTPHKKPRRHVAVKKDGRLACGHTPLPTEGRWCQYPLSMRAFLANVSCPICRAYLEGLAAARVVRRSVNPG